MGSVKTGVASRAAVGVAIAATLLAQASGTAHAVAGSSSAFGFEASLGTLSVPRQAASAYPAGPPESQVPFLDLGAFGSVTGISSSSSGNASEGTTTSTAGIESSDITFGGAGFTSEAVTTTCNAAPGADPTGSVNILGASVTAAGTTVNLPASPAPNQTVALPGGLGEVVLNEQVRDAGSLTVNALRVTVPSLDVNFTVASATCKAGTKDAALGQITGKAVNQGGRLLGGVVYQLKPGDPTCTTNSTGRCTFSSLDPGTYRLCVVDVPDGYSLPEPRCKGPFRINGNSLTVTFIIPPESGKKG